jgi:hypothetical protein
MLVPYEDIELSFIGCKEPIHVFYGKSHFSIMAGSGCTVEELINDKLHNPYILDEFDDKFEIYFVEDNNISGKHRLGIEEFIRGGSVIALINKNVKYYKLNVIYSKGDCREFNYNNYSDYDNNNNNHIRDVIDKELLYGAIWIEIKYSYVPMLKNHYINDKFIWRAPRPRSMKKQYNIFIDKNGHYHF